MCLAACWPAAALDERPPARTYTNEDLDRVSPRRAETGVASEPVAGARRPEPRPQQGSSLRDEDFWRREAERERRRLEPLRRRLSDVEQKLAERRQKPGVRLVTDPIVAGYLAQIQKLRERIREEESRFEDRARREGALPGWLR